MFKVNFGERSGRIHYLLCIIFSYYDETFCTKRKKIIKIKKKLIEIIEEQQQRANVFIHVFMCCCFAHIYDNFLKLNKQL